MPHPDEVVNQLSDQTIKLNALNQEQAKRIRSLTDRANSLAENNNALRQENKGLMHGLALAGIEIERLKALADSKIQCA